MMLTTLEEINAVLDVDPGIDPAVFWPRVGVSVEAISIYGRMVSVATGVPWATVMASMETGATLAEHHLKAGA